LQNHALTTVDRNDRHGRTRTGVRHRAADERGEAEQVAVEALCRLDVANTKGHVVNADDCRPPSTVGAGASQAERQQQDDDELVWHDLPIPDPNRRG
jgi:hypothetical protein